MTQNSYLTLLINGQILTGWESINIKCGVESSTNSFDLTTSQIDPANPSAMPPLPGSTCQLQLFGKQVINGRVDRVTASINAESHTYQVQGRGLCRNLTDCSAVLPNGSSQVSAKDAVELAQNFATNNNFKIPVVYKGGGKLIPIPYFVVNQGETPYEVIEKVCRYSGLLCYEDFSGNLVLSGIGTTKMASAIADGPAGNVESASYTNAVDLMYSQYSVLYSGVDVYGTVSTPGSAGVGSAANQKGNATDETIKEFRPLIIVSGQIVNNRDYAQELAEWHMARARGRGLILHVSVDSWTDSAGTPWTPNNLVDVNISSLGVTGQEMVITEVEFHSPETKADLTLMNKEGLTPQPTILNNAAQSVGGSNGYDGQNEDSHG